MKEVLLNLGRRKLRTGLTVFGITIGIFALAVMGSLSEYLTTTIDSAIKYSADIVRVLPKSGAAGPGSGAVKESAGDKLKNIAHVKAVSGAIITQVGSGGLSNNPLTAKYVIGVNPEIVADVLVNVQIDSGRLVQPGDVDTAVVGHNVAQADNLSVGSVKDFDGHKITIVGILKPTQSSQIDDYSVVPLKTVQNFNDTPGIVSVFILIPDKPENAQLVADEVNNTYGTQFTSLSPTDIKKQIQQGLLIFNIIILAGAALATIVGGFATINTMIMSITERTREIGIKKAIGASNLQIMGEFLMESAFIGFLGGLVGISLGKIATIGINTYTSANVGGLQIFDLTPRLALLALGFATLLGAIAGIIPAIAAARMNIVKALRTE